MLDGAGWLVGRVFSCWLVFEVGKSFLLLLCADILSFLLDYDILQDSESSSVSETLRIGGIGAAHDVRLRAIPGSFPGIVDASHRRSRLLRWPPAHLGGGTTSTKL